MWTMPINVGVFLKTHFLAIKLSLYIHWSRFMQGNYSCTFLKRMYNLTRAHTHKMQWPTETLVRILDEIVDLSLMQMHVLTRCIHFNMRGQQALEQHRQLGEDID